MASKIVSPSRPPAVFGYARVSTTDPVDNGISLEEQQRRIEGRCIEQGCHLAGTAASAA